MRIRYGVLVVATALCAGAIGVAASPARGAASDTVYIFNSDGTFNTRASYDGVGSDGTRWMCVVGASTCSLCGACHTPTQTKDATYVNKYDSDRHRKVHFPTVTATLAPGQKLPWGTGASLVLRKTGMAVSLNASGKDIAVLPANSTILLNSLKRVQLVALPPTTDVKFVP
jgi:hypothetical protein